MFKHSGKQVVKSIFGFAIIYISDLAAQNQIVSIRWKRGKKSGNTKKSIVNKFGVAQWNEEFKLQTKMFKQKNSDLYDKKTLLLSIKMDRENQKGIVLIGKVVISINKLITENQPTIKEYLVNIKNPKKHKMNPKLLICLRLIPNLKIENFPKLLDNEFVKKKINEFEKNRSYLKNDFRQENYSSLSEKTLIPTDTEYSISELENKNDSSLTSNNRNQNENLSQIKKEKTQIIEKEDDSFDESMSSNDAYDQYDEYNSKIKEKSKNQIQNQIQNQIENENENEKIKQDKKPNRRQIETLKEQINILEKQEIKIDKLKQKIELETIIHQEKQLIERMVYFMDVIYNDKKPLPACLFFKFLVYYDCFSDSNSKRNEIIFTTFIESVNLFVEFQRENVPKMIWIMSNILFMMSLLTKKDEFIKDENQNSNEIQNQNQNHNHNKKAPIKTISSMFLNNISQEDNLMGFLSKELYSIFYRIFLFVIHQITDKLKPKVLLGFLEQQEPNRTKNIRAKSKKIKTPNSTIKYLHKILKILQTNYFPEELIISIIKQIVYFIDCTLFHELLNRDGLCTQKKVLQIKLGLSQLEDWMFKNGFKSITNEIRHIRQATDCITLNKILIKEPNSCSEVCPDLNLFQIHELLSKFIPDEFDPQVIPTQSLLDFRKFAEKNHSEEVVEIEIDSSIIFRIIVDFNQISTKGWDLIQVPSLMKGKIEFTFLNNSLQELLKINQNQN